MQAVFSPSCRWKHSLFGVRDLRANGPFTSYLAYYSYNLQSVADIVKTEVFYVSALIVPFDFLLNPLNQAMKTVRIQLKITKVMRKATDNEKVSKCYASPHLKSLAGRWKQESRLGCSNVSARFAERATKVTSADVLYGKVRHLACNLACNYRAFPSRDLAGFLWSRRRAVGRKGHLAKSCVSKTFKSLKTLSD